MIRVAAVLGAVIAESLALYTLAEWAAAGYDVDRRTVGWYSFVLVALVAYALPRVTEWFALSNRAATITFFVTAYVVVYGILRLVYAEDFALWDLSWIASFINDSDIAVGEGFHAFFTGILLLGLWARQSTRSAFDMDLEAMPRAIGPVFLVVTGVAVLGALTDRSGEVGRGAAAFYAVAIMTLACSQLALSGASLPDIQAGGIAATLLGGVAAATVAAVALAALLLTLFGPIIGPPLGRGVDLLLTAILTPPALLLSWFFDLLFPDTLDLSRTVIVDRGAGREDGEPNDPSALAEASAAGFRSLIIFAIILGAGALVLYFARVRRKVQQREEDGPVRATVGSLGDDFSSLWRSLRRRSASAPLNNTTGVTRLYREMLDSAEATGNARRPAETPHEFAPTLQETFHRPVTDEITHAFEQSRYAGREPDTATLAALERRWRESV